MEAFKRLYGANPGHLVAMAFCFAMTGYAVWSIFGNASPLVVLLWLWGAIVVHDFVLLPFYTMVFWLASRFGRTRGRRRRATALHHVVAPAALSGLLLLAWLPLVLRLSEANYLPTTGMTQEPYLWRWLGLTLALFAVSGVLYGLRSARMRRAAARERRRGAL